MRIGIRIPPCRPLPEVVKVARRAEEVGFDTVGIPDSPTLWRDTISALCCIALDTERVTLTTAVSNFVTRAPIVLASAARTVSELAPRRFRLSIGVGSSAVILTRQRPSRTEELREGVRIVSELLAGRPAHRDHPDMVLHDPGGPIPIYVAAEGPRNLALAAEIGDGVITNYRGVIPKLQAITTTVESIGRVRPLKRLVLVQPRVTEDFERDALANKPEIAKFASTSYGRSLLEQSGFPISIPLENTLLADGTDFGHPRDVQGAIAAASQWISDELAIWFCENYCLYGTSDDIVRRLNELAALGVDEVQCTSADSFTMPIELIEQFGKDVIPKLSTMAT